MFKANNLLKQLVYLASPLILKYLFFFLFVDWDVFNIEDIKEDIIFFILIAVLVHSKFFQKSFLKNILLVVYILYFILETTSYLAVSSTFSSSYMYLLLESGSEELKEFAGGYFNWTVFLSFFLFVILFFILRKKEYTIKSKYPTVIAFACAGIILITLKFTGLIESNAYHNIVRGTYGYYSLQKNMKLTPSINLNDITISSENEVLVLVLGESTNRSHMQLYGYNRETTPNLSKRTDDLFVYDNVISTEVFTLKAVPKILTSLNLKSNNDDLVDIVQVLKAAGYNTYWLSNQRPISYHDNAISEIASGSKYFKFYNHLIDRDTKVLDEEMLPDYRDILDEPGKKLIVLRLIGTHFDYDNRYPKTFDNFSKSNVSKSQKLRNEYDNAILYNDFIVNEIIEYLNKKNLKSALVYLSDHGENIYDYGTDFFGRSEEILTPNMFEIPFLLWTSKDFEKPLDFEYKRNRPFTAEFTYDSLGHIFGVLHSSMNTEKSIFSNRYKEDKRIVVGNRDFDTYFKTKE
ncbi:phosphoethanolamine transferase [Winogradskyella litorisediminis]|uniref:Phosphoethanolamine transferase n=1 Tax=Winogradskyella litorisediminis TaxID=1156618 RepID=A0ABW3N782_9FLAO